MNFLRGRIRALVLLAVFGVSALPAVGQGCAMCNAAARATPKEGQQALNRAILVMLIPPVGLMAFGVGLAFRYSKRRDQDQG